MHCDPTPPMASPTSDNDIAIIGTSCRVAGANSPSELWDNLASSQDVQSKITRFNVDGFYHPEGASRKGLTNVRHAYMLDDDCIDKFDNAFFYTTPQEAIAMDPQQRMLLEIAYEAIGSAGISLDDFMGTDTVVFAGTLIPPMCSSPTAERRYQAWKAVTTIQSLPETSMQRPATSPLVPQRVWPPTGSATSSFSQDLASPSTQRVPPPWQLCIKLSGRCSMVTQVWRLCAAQSLSWTPTCSFRPLS